MFIKTVFSIKYRRFSQEAKWIFSIKITKIVFDLFFVKIAQIRLLFVRILIAQRSQAVWVVKIVVMLL